jgi:hypothetical protein
VRAQLTSQGTCPSCGEQVLLDWDSDGKRWWVHEIYRHCSCPMPERLADYGALIPGPDGWTAQDSI